jgi:hypothetical protein
MNYTELISELIDELSYRVGIPNIYDKEHQRIMSEILTEWDKFDEKKIIFEFLTEDDEKRFSNPILNRKIKYTGKDGKEREGLVGNLLTSPKDSPGRIEAEKLLPAPGTPEREKINKEIGSQGGGGEQDSEGGGETPQEEPKQGQALSKNTKSGKSYHDRVVSKEEETRNKINKEKEKNTSSDSSKNSNASDVLPNQKPPKNKKLNQVDSVNEFNTNSKFADDGVSDEDFNKNPNIVKTTKQIEFTEQDLDRILGKPRKFPKKYEKVIIRLLNTKKSKDITITDFTNAAGGGTLSSTAGEILTTIGLSIKDDAMAKEFFDKIEAHVKDTKSESIIDTAWVKSAKQVREATIRRYDRIFGKGNWELETMAWDIPDEVEALGLEDYKNNKGFSTDTYAKVKVNGESILDEISLKKSKTANLLNTTTNRVDDIFFRGSATQEELDEMESLETEYNTISSKQDKASKERKLEIVSRVKELQNKYNKNVPEDAKVEVTKKKQTNIHKKGLEKNGQNLREANQKYSSLSQEEKDKAFRELELMMGQNFSPKQRQQFEDIFAQITPPLNYEQLKQLNSSLGLGTDARKVQKTSVMLHGMSKILGNPAGETYDELVKNAHTHSSAVANSILSDKNAKMGLLKSIQEDFPLKSLMAGEENMTLGNLSADKQTLAEVFGVDDFDKLQENLKVRETPPPPSIVYSVEGEEDIPVAEISTRPDGIGYGGTWKLEMKVHKEFAQRIEAAQSKLEQ